MASHKHHLAERIALSGVSLTPEQRAFLMELRAYRRKIAKIIGALSQQAPPAVIDLNEDLS